MRCKHIIVEKLAREADKPICLYIIRHFNGDKVIRIGEFITDYNDNILFSTDSHKYKNNEVITEFKKFINRSL